MNFHCVYGFDRSKEDFILIGVFTLRKDADAFALTPEAVAQQGGMSKLVVMEQSLSMLKAQLIAEHLGILERSLCKLAEIPTQEEMFRALEQKRRE